MLFEHAYSASSTVANTADRTGMSFSPDLKREPTFFHGELAAPIVFREAISALHDVVVSDLRFKAKDRDAYKAWASDREERDLEEIMAQSENVREQIDKARAELDELTRQSARRMAPFYRARQRYFDYLYKPVESSTTCTSVSSDSAK